MSSRSIGVMKVWLSFRAMSCVMPSPTCSNVFDPPCLVYRVPVILHHLLQQAAPFNHVAGRFLKHLEERLVSGNQAEHT